MLNKKILISFLLVLIAAASHAQESNLEKYTPSVLFSKGTWELNTFYNLYTQRSVRNTEGDEINLGQRQTFLNAMYQFTYGVSTSRRWNVGLDIYVNRVLYDNDEGSPFEVLTFSDGAFDRTVVSAIGPRIKFVPLPKVNGLSIQSSFLFPVADDLESPSFTAHDRYTWFTQTFYDRKLNSKWRIFLELDFLYRIRRNNSQVNFFRLPASGFLSYFPNHRATLFAFGQYAPRFQTISNEVDEKFGLSNWYTQVGIGAKYQLTPKLGLELSYGNFIKSRHDGAGYALNLGFRYIKAQ